MCEIPSHSLSGHKRYYRGKACPARLEVMYQECRQGAEAVIQVRYWKTHCGHEHQIERLPLTRQIKCLIAEKLEEGYSFEETIKMICEVEPNDVISKRLQLLSRKDMYNIIRNFNIKSKKQNQSTKSNNHSKCNINYTQIDIPHKSTLNDSKYMDISTINETKIPDISTLNDNENVDMKICPLNENKKYIFTINKELVDTTELFLDLINVVDLNVEDSIYIENEIRSLIEKTVKSDFKNPNNRVEIKLEPETDECSVSIKNETIDKSIANESLKNVINVLLNTVKMVALSQEDSLYIEEQINQLMKRAKLLNIDKLSDFVSERIQSQETIKSPENTCSITVKLERI